MTTHPTGSRFSWLAAVACGTLLGCASAPPPQQLVDARAAYARAANSGTAQLSPAALHSARVALDGAERTFKATGDSPETQDQAYVALRRAQLAETTGKTAYYRRELSAHTSMAVQDTQSELEQTRAQLAAEQQARQAAEQRANEALARLQNKPENVITLPGNVLFSPGKAELKPGARNDLNRVADALKDRTNAEILVQGHTDATGSEQVNEQLSKQRAQAVSSYLADHGVSEQRLVPQGFGSRQPVASNDTPEGRASNRRVEIVVEPRH